MRTTATSLMLLLLGMGSGGGIRTRREVLDGDVWRSLAVVILASGGSVGRWSVGHVDVFCFELSVAALIDRRIGRARRWYCSWFMRPVIDRLPSGGRAEPSRLWQMTSDISDMSKVTCIGNIA